MIFHYYFFTSITPFQAPLDHFFSSYLMFRILVTFLGHQLQHELPQTQGLWVYLSSYEKFQYAKTHDQVLLNSIHNLQNPGRLNRIFIYVLDRTLQVTSRQLQVFCHLSSNFNLS